MKSLMCLLREVLLDRGTWCGVSTELDLKKIELRVEREGLSFLTITLPTFGKDLEKGLDQGKVDRHLFRGFARSQGSGELPLLLGGFLGLVFDRATGRLLDEPSVDAIQAIRQITLMFAKINMGCHHDRTMYAIRQFVKCEQDVREADANLSELRKEQFKRVGSLLWRDVLQQVDEDIYYERLIPKHGPGATADKLTGNRKYDQREWTLRLESWFPFLEGFVAPNSGAYQDFHHVDILEPGSERPVRVITVPKTLKTPRVIAVEPTAMQYAQQAIAESLVSHLEGKTNPFRWIIGFSDQDPNRSMARKGSLTGDLATLDLSEASDRVSNQLVRELTALWPHVAGAIDAARSRKADVPGKGVIRLAKFASMGSALCFPVEAMVFATIVLCGIEDVLRRRLSRKLIHELAGRVRVYGDDIIVPAEYAQASIQALEDFGLRVNKDKSFWTGRFRESCGKEYFAGEDVSIVRVRDLLPTKRQDASALISTVSLRNQLYKAGYWKTVEFLDDFLERLLTPGTGKRPLYPVVAETSAVLGRVSFLGYETQMYDSQLHSPLVKGFVVQSVIPENQLDGYGALLKFFLKRGDDPFQDREHLMRSGRPMAVSTKPRRARPF
jgi:hypothetical protein